MRNATILVVNLRGVATETIKNIVLAGIGKLIMWDCEDVAAEDLGVGFFFRDEDVGKKVRFFCLLLLLFKLLLRRAGSSLNRRHAISLLWPCRFLLPLLPCPAHIVLMA
jgi:molybdopterin/thiamine biosynthesis adenylyltransferase